MFDFVKFEGGAAGRSETRSWWFCSKSNGSLAVIVGRGAKVIAAVLCRKT